MLGARLETLGQLAPRADWMMAPAATLALALAAAVRMIDRVHHHAAHVRTACPCQRLRPALPLETFMCSMLPTWPMVAYASSLILRISPEGIFTRAKPAFAIVQDDLLAGAARDLTAAAGSQLDVMNVRAQRNGLERQGVAEFRCGGAGRK